MCQNCQSRPPQNNTVEWPNPGKRWSRIHVDHFFFDNSIFFIAVDAFTKYIECLIVKSTSSACTIDALREICSRQGLPDLLISDNATSFTSAEFKQFLQRNHIEHMTPPPYSPQSNGLAERSVQVVKNLLKKNTIGSLKSRLSNILLYYRSTPHSVTKVSPSVLLNNRQIVTLRDKINPSNMSSPKPSEKKIKSFQVGDIVLALNYGKGDKWYQGTIIEKFGVNIYSVLIDELKVTWRRHANQLLSSVGVSQGESDESDTIHVPILSPSSDTSGTNYSSNVDSTNNSENADEVANNDIDPRPLPRRSQRVPKPVERLNL